MSTGCFRVNNAIGSTMALMSLRNFNNDYRNRKLMNICHIWCTSLINWCSEVNYLRAINIILISAHFERKKQIKKRD